MSAQSPPGFFGKLPCNGDFIQHGVPQEWLETWDHWLQSGIYESRNALREEWLNAYLSGPIWRFVLSEGACGSGAYAGIMVPSVDRVGRYFPLTLVRQLDAGWNPLDVAVLWTPWFEALEQCVCGALDTPDLRLEDFIAQVHDVQDPLTFAVPTHIEGELFRNTGFPSASPQWHVSLQSADHLQLDVAVLAYREIYRHLRPVTLWWTSGAERVQASWLLARGLPSAGSFAAMLDGSWRGSEWSSANPGAVHTMPVRTQAPTPAPEPLIPESAPALDARAHLPTHSPSDVEGNLAAFVVRPDIGLWAVVTPNGETPVRATRTVADALQNVAPAATLTLLAEGVRQMLLRVSQRLADETARNPLNPAGLANVLAAVKAGNECAFISAGDAQVLRVRDGITVPMIGAQSAAMASGSDLISLVSARPGGSSEPCGSSDLDHVPVVYDHAAAGDVWLLGGSHDASDAATAAWSSGDPSAMSMERVVREFTAATGGRPPPLLMLEIG